MAVCRIARCNVVSSSGVGVLDRQMNKEILVGVGRAPNNVIAAL